MSKIPTMPCFVLVFSEQFYFSSLIVAKGMEVCVFHCNHDMLAALFFFNEIAKFQVCMFCISVISSSNLSSFLSCC